MNLVQYDIASRQLLASTAVTIESFDISGEIELVPHACGGYWIVAHDANGLNYYSFRLWSQLELTEESVVSQLGIDRTEYPSRRKLSLIPARNLILVSALERDVPAIEFLSLDPASGRLSLTATISYPSDFSGFVEPSPDGQLLYAHIKSINFPNGMILQYDISDIDSQIIEDSELLLASPVDGGTQDITTGPDNKIYINEDERVISVINNPNERGVNADYEANRFTAIFSQFLFLPHHFRVDMITPPIMDIDAISIEDPICSVSITGLYNSLPDGSLFVNDIRVNDISTFQLDTGLNFLRIVDDLCVSSDSLFYSPITSDLLPQDTLLCLSESIMIDLSEFESVFWSDGSLDLIRDLSAPGDYIVDVIDDLGCSAVDSFSIIPIDDIDLLPDSVVLECIDDRLIQTLSVPESTSNILWSTGDTSSSIVVDQPGVFTVEVDSEGCMLTDTVEVTIDKDCELPEDIPLDTTIIVPIDTLNTISTIDCNIYIPNAISLSSTRGNDLFAPVSTCALLDYSLEIYDRWGGSVYSSNNPTEGWEGADVNPGIYIYNLSYRLEGSDRTIIDSGTLTLIN